MSAIESKEAFSANPEVETAPTWSETMAKIVAKCEVAGHFGHEVCWNAEGARAMGLLIKTMAANLDEANRRLAALKEPSHG